MTPIETVLGALRDRDLGPKQTQPGQWQARCPAHQDRVASLSLGTGDDGRVLMKCHAGCDTETVVKALGLSMADLFAPEPGRARPRQRIVATYDYTDAQKQVLYQVVRLSPGFTQRRPDGNGGWVWNLRGVPRVLYRLPELAAAHPDAPTFICEGEKDCDALAGIGLVATTCPQGAGKWAKLADDSALHGRHVVIIPDADTPGRRHAEDVASRLHGRAAEVRVLELPGAKDAADWLALGNGNDREKLLELAAQTPMWTPTSTGTITTEALTGEDIELLTDFTDAGNALILAHLFGDRLRYDHRKERWLLWRGHWWAEDNDGEPVRLALEAAQWRAARAHQLDGPDHAKRCFTWALRSRDRGKLDACLAVARNLPPLTDSGDGWDSDPWLLAVENGIIDLKTGKLRPGRAEDRITIHIPHRYDPDAECLRWLRFLDEIFDSNEELAQFVRRAVGYTFTGSTREQCFFMLHGTGANGKSVFLAVLRHVLGPFAFDAGFQTFEAARSRSGHPEELAELAGRRLVTATETSERTTLNEARLKVLSHGDTTSARHLYSRRFEFTPTCKVWLAVNHRPRVGDDSLGFWRSVRLIPFEQVFSPKQEPDLLDTLKAEAPGILAWAMKGCLEWQEHSLQNPVAVQEATTLWEAESDPLAEFLADRCIVRTDTWATSLQLWEAYGQWADSEKVPQRERLTRKTFGRRLGERFKADRFGTKRRRGFAGVGLLSLEPDRSDPPFQQSVPSESLAGGVSGKNGLKRSEAVGTGTRELGEDEGPGHE